jgi:O-antigen/teichoic acid export membrane protein
MINRRQYILKLKNSTLFKDSLWALSANVIGQGLALIASICIARMLGKDIFGMYGLIRTSLLSVAAFSTFGLSYTATKFIAEYLNTYPNRLIAIIRNIMQITLTTSCLFAALIFVFSHQVADYLECPEMFVSIRYLAVIVIFNSISTTQTSILAGFKRFKSVARISSINGIFLFVCSIGLTYYFGLNGALLAILFAQLFNCLQYYIEVKKTIKLLNIKSENTKYSVRKELLFFSLPMALQEMISPVFMWISPVIMVKFSNFGELGLYNAAQQWYAILLFIPSALRNVILSNVSANSDNPHTQFHILNRMLLFNLSVVCILALIVFFASGLIERTYGDTFSSMRVILNISVFTAVFVCLNNLFRQFFMAVNRVWGVLFIYLSSSITTILLFIAFSVLINDGKSGMYMALSSLIVQIIFCTIYYFMYNYQIKKVLY